MKIRREPVRFRSLDDEIAGVIFLPNAESPSPALITCHGAGDFKENYFEMCERIAESGIAALALDMHGHGESGGDRFYVEMRQWVADVRAAVDYLQTRPEVNGERIAAFGLSSGGTAILEAALLDPRLKALIALDATVRDSLPKPMSWLLKALLLLGKLKLRLTSQPLRLPLGKFSGEPELASDPKVNREILDYPRSWEGLNAFPLPGGEQAFFVDTLRRVSQITAPTLVLWGEDDKIDSPETGRLLHAALTCKKALHIIQGNGHVGHRDRHKEKVFALTADWIFQSLREAPMAECAGVWHKHGIQNHHSGGSQEAWAKGQMGFAFPIS